MHPAQTCRNIFLACFKICFIYLSTSYNELDGLFVPVFWLELWTSDFYVDIRFDRIDWISNILSESWISVIKVVHEWTWATPMQWREDQKPGVWGCTRLTAYAVWAQVLLPLLKHSSKMKALHLRVPGATQEDGQCEVVSMAASSSITNLLGC